MFAVRGAGWRKMISLELICLKIETKLKLNACSQRSWLAQDDVLRIDLLKN